MRFGRKKRQGQFSVCPICGVEHEPGTQIYKDHILRQGRTSHYNTDYRALKDTAQYDYETIAKDFSEVVDKAAYAYQQGDMEAHEEYVNHASKIYAAHKQWAFLADLEESGEFNQQDWVDEYVYFRQIMGLHDPHQKIPFKEKYMKMYVDESSIDEAVSAIAEEIHHIQARKEWEASYEEEVSRKKKGNSSPRKEQQEQKQEEPKKEQPQKEEVLRDDVTGLKATQINELVDFLENAQVSVIPTYTLFSVKGKDDDHMEMIEFMVKHQVILKEETPGGTVYAYIGNQATINSALAEIDEGIESLTKKYDDQEEGEKSRKTKKKTNRNEREQQLQQDEYDDWDDEAHSETDESPAANTHQEPRRKKENPFANNKNSTWRAYNDFDDDPNAQSRPAQVWDKNAPKKRKDAPILQTVTRGFEQKTGLSKYGSTRLTARKRVGPFIINTGVGGVLGISSIGLAAGPITWTLWSKNYKSGLSSVDLPGFLSFRGKKARK